MGANNTFETTQKLARVFLEKFDAARIMSKNVNTQLLTGQFTPETGDTVYFKRPTDYKSKRTATGDISGGPRSDIIMGKASGVVQNYFTVDIDWNEADEAIKMDQLDQLLAPAATRIKNDLEVDFASFMLKNTGLYAGAYGTAVTTWDHVAEAGALMQSTGVPMDEQWYYALNPYTQTKLASAQKALYVGEALVSDAYKNAMLADNVAGLRVMSATTLPTVTVSGADRVGAIAANPDVTYNTARNTMTQTISVSGFTASMTFTAGEIMTITGRFRLNNATKQLVINDAGAPITWSGTVTADATMDVAGAGTVILTGPAIFEATGAYNTVNSAPIATDVITGLGTAGSTYQPNLFWHKNAFSIGSVPIKKLYSTDTIATTEDGLQFRVSKYANGDTNKQIVRFDFRPAYAALNPFFAGQGFGR